MCNEAYLIVCLVNQPRGSPSTDATYAVVFFIKPLQLDKEFSQ